MHNLFQGPKYVLVVTVKYWPKCGYFVAGQAWRIGYGFSVHVPCSGLIVSLVYTCFGMSLFRIHLLISENNCQHVRHKPYTVHRTRHPHQGRLEHEYHATYKMITQKKYVVRCRVKFGNLICIRHLFRTSPKFDIYFRKSHVFIHTCAASIAYHLI